MALGALGYFLGFPFFAPVALVSGPLAVYLAVQRPTRRDTAWATVLALITAWGLLGPTDGFLALERAWVALLAGSLVVVLAAGRRRGFLTTTLPAVTLAGLGAAVLMMATHLTLTDVTGVAQQHFFLLRRAMVDYLAPVGSPMRPTLDQSVKQFYDVVGRLLPGVALLQSLAGMALAWALYHRVAQRPQSEPLGPLAAFRFNDHLIWGVALSLLGVVIARLGWVQGSAGDLLVFFGGLYLVRGVAVLAAVAGAVGFGGALAYLAALLAALLLWPVVTLAALAVGLTDTLVDWRQRLARAAPKL